MAFAVCVVSCATGRSGGVARHRPENATSAQALLHEYWNHPKDSEARFRGVALEVSGLVERVWEPEPGRRAVDLKVGERGYHVRCWLAAETAREPPALEADQLVAVHGVAGGPVVDNPWLDSCAVAWAGRRRSDPGQIPELEAKRLALSADRCVEEEREAQIAALEKEYPDAGALQLYLGKLTEQRSRTSSALAALGRVSEPCSHPLLRVIARCRAPFLFSLWTPERVIERNQLYEQRRPPDAQLCAQLGECAAAEVLAVLDAEKSRADRDFERGIAESNRDLAPPACRAPREAGVADAGAGP